MNVPLFILNTYVYIYIYIYIYSNKILNYPSENFKRIEKIRKLPVNVFHDRLTNSRNEKRKTNGDHVVLVEKVKIIRRYKNLFRALAKVMADPTSS